MNINIHCSLSKYCVVKKLKHISKGASLQMRLPLSSSLGTPKGVYFCAWLYEFVNTLSVMKEIINILCINAQVRS